MATQDREEMLKALDGAYNDFVSGLFRNYIDGLLAENAKQQGVGTSLPRFERGVLLATKARADAIKALGI